jgi:organic hydroperoxide reductase OsmC/OhrA
MNSGGTGKSKQVRRERTRPCEGAAHSDHAEGVTEEITPDKQAITKVVLHPQIEWIGETPEKAKLDAMHHEAHEVCFIANSVKTRVTVAKRFR